MRDDRADLDERAPVRVLTRDDDWSFDDPFAADAPLADAGEPSRRPLGVSSRRDARAPLEPRRRPVAHDDTQRRLKLGLALVGVLGVAAIGAIVTADDTGDSDAIALTADGASPEAALDDIAAAAQVLDQTADGGEPFVEFTDVELSGVPDEDPETSEAIDTSENDAARADGGCTIEALSLRIGATGDGVSCLQGALAEAGAFTGTANGTFDQATFDAVMRYQESEDLFVDGVVGRETALSLNVWPDEESFVVRTPRPAPGAKDLWGVELSPVASAGDSAPPLPDNSGSGYRVVYDRAGQRVWAVDENEQIVRSWLVSGSTYSNELPGTHYVYSRSEVSTAWNGKAYLPLMIRWLKTERGNIGFHGIPTKVSTGEAYQTTDELGTRLSGGCQRQHNLDATFLWGFAPVGTKVVVL